MNHLIGEWLNSDHGTSAGTVLGAILFLTYAHDTPVCIFPKFADDLASISVANDIDKLELCLQNTLDQMAQWADKWNMLLNTSKTKVMLFGSRQRPLRSGFSTANQINLIGDHLPILIGDQADWSLIGGGKTGP